MTSLVLSKPLEILFFMENSECFLVSVRLDDGCDLAGRGLVMIGGE